MLKTKPLPLDGPWADGFALDVHTTSSQYIGDDAYGHPQFETVRSPVGEALYQLKYRADKSVAAELCQTAAEFVKSKHWKPTLVVPVPPSRPGRHLQPVPLLAKGIAKLLDCPYGDKCLLKVKDTPELKSVYDYTERLEQLKGAYAVETDTTRDQDVLLVDDLYRSGATLEAATNALLRKGKATRVRALTFTRTRSNR